MPNVDWKWFIIGILATVAVQFVLARRKARS